jgi:hypothetical protein
VWFLNWEPATCDFARAEQVAWLFGVNDVGTVCQHHRELRTWGAGAGAGLHHMKLLLHLALEVVRSGMLVAVHGRVRGDSDRAGRVTRGSVSPNTMLVN